VPRTPKQTANPIAHAESQKAVVNGATADVLTLEEAAAYLRVPETEVLELIHSQGLPSRSTGSGWRFLRAGIQEWLRSGSPATQARKEARLALAGKYKDDPDLVRICEEAYRQRGRPHL
jgi:excisionase family DNA binding protein